MVLRVMKAAILIGPGSLARWHHRLVLFLCLLGTFPALAAPMERVAVSSGGAAFVLKPSGRAFVPWGFNYDHDDGGRLLEDYWNEEWAAVEGDFREMKELGANVVRVHLQVGRFMRSATKPDPDALEQLRRLVALAEQENLYLDVTGLGCYHKADVPPWYDAMGETERWAVQKRFWRSVAGVCADSPAIFCYDLMNEPVAPVGQRRTDWLGGAFAGKHFVQWISLDARERSREEVAREWIATLVDAVREVDAEHLITVGLVPWSLDLPGKLYSGFSPEKVGDRLDFVSVHLYPEKGNIVEALGTLSEFSLGKPVVIEEIFPLKCGMEEFEEFIRRSSKRAAGWIGFYWGKTPEECRQSPEIKDQLILAWLEFFRQGSPQR